MVMKVCPVCQTPFEARGRQQYCSAECRRVNYKDKKAEAQRRWVEKNPDYFKEYQREHPEYSQRFLENNPDYFKKWAKNKREEDPEYFIRQQREYEPQHNNNAQLGSQQYVARADWSEKPTDGGLTKEQQRQLDDIKRLKRQCGLE